MASFTVEQLGLICNGTVEGPGNNVISGANALEEATVTDLSFCETPRSFESAARSEAGCLLVPRPFDKAGQWSLIRVESPRTAFAKALRALYPEQRPEPFVHSTALIAASATVGPGSSIGAYVTVGEGTHIGPNCVVSAGCRVGEHVSIGAGSTLHPNVTVYNNVQIGERVVLHAGCVIGADGFGYTFATDHYEKFPQIGSVAIGNDVEMGANCCVDRAALGVTRIGDGTKLDNLVHIAHNCVLGRHVVIAAQAGFSGGATVGDYAIIGGQAGVGEKARIDAKAIVGGKSGVLTGRRIEPGEPVWGIPARPLRQHLKNLAYLSKLPELRDEVKQLQNRVRQLENSKESSQGEDALEA